MRPRPLDTAHALYLSHRNLDALLEAVIDAAFRQARRKAPEDVAEDIAQRTALVVWKKLDQFRPTGRFSSWVGKIAAIEIAHHWSHAHPEPVALEERHELAAEEPKAEELPELTRDEHLLLHLRAENYSFDEIGNILGVTAAQARKIIFRLRRKLEQSATIETVKEVTTLKANAQDGPVPVQPSLRMGPVQMDQIAQGLPHAVPLLEFWEPRFQVIRMARIPETDITFAA